MTLRSKILNPFYNLLLPPACFGCNTLLSGGEVHLCTRCRHQLPLTRHTFIEENALDIEYGYLLVVRKCAALMHFSDRGVVRRLLHALKYRNHPELGSFFARWAWESTDIALLSGKLDAVVPVPISRAKRLKRGYNQLSRFGHELAQLTGVPYLPHALIRNEKSKTQSRRNKAERWRKGLSEYQWNPEAGLKDSSVLLIDDVTTTGATLHACIRRLEEAGVRSIHILCMATVSDR